MEKPRIQDDLYTYVNQEKLDQLVIPDDKPCIGGFQTIAEEVEETMINEFRTMSESNSFPNDHLKRAVSLYNIAKNAEKKAKDGIAPALNKLKLVKELNDIADLNANFKTLMLEQLPLPLNISVDTDMKDTKKHIVYIQGPRVILPDASYYKPEMAPQRDMILGIWTNVAKMIIAQTDLSPEEQEKYISDALAFDAILGGLVKTSEEWSEYVKMYNPRCSGRVATSLKPLNFKAILSDLFGSVPAKVVVAEPRFVKNFASVINEETFDLYKHWAYVKGLCSACSLLSEELREIESMYFRTIAGIPANTPIEKFAYQLASSMYAEPVGLYYGEKYFGEAAKKDITEIVYQIIDTYKSRIENNEILGEETKKKAIVKLSKMGVKMGYPDKVRDIFNKLEYGKPYNKHIITVITPP